MSADAHQVRSGPAPDFKATGIGLNEGNAPVSGRSPVIKLDINSTALSDEHLRRARQGLKGRVLIVAIS